MELVTRRTDQTATNLARSASALMLVSAATSAYWAAGGTGLLDTVGGSIARWGQEGGPSVRLALATVVVLKLAAAWLPLRAVRESRQPTVRKLAWLEAAILTVYGGVLTVSGVAVQAHLLNAGADPDWKALDWHVYLWDPWFLIVGLLVWGALQRSREWRHEPHWRRRRRAANA